MGEPQDGTRWAWDGGPGTGQSDELSHLIGVDLQMFRRLHEGDPRPLRLTLRDGRQITGELKRIARGIGSSEEIASRPWGRVLVETSDGDMEVSYLDIAEVS